MDFTLSISAFKRMLVPGLIWFCCTASLTAFGNAPKYIFYWGKMQCELLETTGYQGTIEVPANLFRESVFAMPYLWNGKRVCDTLRFKLENNWIESIKEQKEQYLEYQAVIDQKFARDAQAGQVFQITGLALDEHLTGNISITILPEKAADKHYRRFPGGDQPIVVMKEWLDYFNWGLFITENMQRDYFTVEEVINTIKTEPVFLWNQYKVPDGMEVHIGAVDTRIDFPTTVADIEKFPYKKFSAQFLKSYGHLIQPGINIEFGLRTLHQRHLEMRARMIVVEDDDPRLKLRRTRDGHQLTIKWDELSGVCKSLYLKQLPNNKGEKISCDPEITFFLSGVPPKLQPGQPIIAFPPQPGNYLTQIFTSLPVFTVDEVDLGNLSFDILYKAQTWHIGAGELLPASLQEVLNEEAKNGETTALLILKNISGSDYFDLSPLTFNFLLLLPTPDK